MNCTSKRNGAGVILSAKLVIFATLYLIAITSTHSQNLSNTGKTEISYKRLNEFAKYVAFKQKADSIIYQYSQESIYKDSIIRAKDLKIEQFTVYAVPALERKIALNDSILNNTRSIMALKEQDYEAKIRAQRRGGWYKLGGGVLIGLLLSLLLGG